VSAHELRAVTTDAEGTRSLAGAVAALARPGDVVLLVGGLGAGKTTFAQGFARGLGIDGPVTSPTFTLVRQYPVPNQPPSVTGIAQLLHADVYRLDSLAEVADLALAELVEDGAVALVEWGDAAAPVLPAAMLRVALVPRAVIDDDTEPARDLVLESHRGAWADRWGALGDAVRVVAAEPGR